MQYLVVESNGIDSYDSRHRLCNFADSYSRDVQRAMTPAPTIRHARATSVGFPAREVEIIRRPLYDGLASDQTYFYTPSRQPSRAASVAFGVEPSHYHSRGRNISYRETTPMPCSGRIQNGDIWSGGTSTSRPRRRYYSGCGTPSHVLKPSMWYIGTAGFSDDSNERTRRMQARMEGLMNYVPPPADYYLSMKQSLRGINEKMLQHRQLIDRYAGIDNTPTKSVEEGIQERYYELVERMPELERSYTRKNPTPSENFSHSTSSFQPRRERATTPSVGASANQETSAVRGKIKKLLARTKHSG